MNEIMLYVGSAVAIVLFILTIYLFISLKIVEILRYFVKTKGKKLAQKRPVKAPPRVRTKTDNILDDKTELLSAAENFATALIDADNTELLPSLYEE